jgi:hypothetical protein
MKWKPTAMTPGHWTGGGDSSGSFVMAAKANELFDIDGNYTGLRCSRVTM